MAEELALHRGQELGGMNNVAIEALHLEGESEVLCSKAGKLFGEVVYNHLGSPTTYLKDRKLCGSIIYSLWKLCPFGKSEAKRKLDRFGVGYYRWNFKKGSHMCRVEEGGF